MGSVVVSGDRRRLWRSRWAAVGAAVAVTLGGGGLLVARAADSSGPSSSVVMIDAVRILDTRDPSDVGLAGPFTSAVSQKLQVAGPVSTTTGTQTPVPVGATGVLLNVTVVAPSADGFLSVRPGDATGSPSTSSLNFKAGDLIPNSVQVGLPTAGANAGKIDITYDAYGQAGPTTEVLVDVVGYTTPSGTVSGWVTKTDNAASATFRASSPSFFVIRIGQGNYRAGFGDIAVANCSWVATPSTDTGLPNATGIQTAGDSLAPSWIVVRTSNAAGLLVDSGFQIQLTC